MSAEYVLPHWDAELSGQPENRLNVVEDNHQLVISAHEAPAPGRTFGRSIILETRDDGTLAVMVYGIDCEEPYTILLPTSGKPLLIQEP